MRFSTNKKLRKPSRDAQSGATLVEMMIGILVLGIALSGPLTLTSTSILTNSRNKLDTTASMLSQTVTERIASMSSTGAATTTIIDCRPAALGGPQTLTIGVSAATSPGSGANISATGDIDFTQAYTGVTANYKMQFYTCATDPNTPAGIYDIRWNVLKIDGLTKQINVSSRFLQGVGANAANSRFFSAPVTLRTMVAN